MFGGLRGGNPYWFNGQDGDICTRRGPPRAECGTSVIQAIHCTQAHLSSRLDLVLPLGAGVLGRESEVGAAQPTFTQIQPTAQVIASTHPPHLSSHLIPKDLRRWVSDNAAGVDTLAAAVAILHAWRLGPYGRLPETEAAKEFGSPPSD